jgi:flagellar biogenesis protein FliO
VLTLGALFCAASAAGQPVVSSTSAKTASDGSLPIPDHDLLEQFGAGTAVPGIGDVDPAGTAVEVTVHVPRTPAWAEGLEADDAPPVPEKSQEVRHPAKVEQPAADGIDDGLTTGSEADLSLGRSDTRPRWQTLEYLWPLAIVLGLIAVGALVLKRHLPARRLLTGTGALEVVARLPLAGKQSLVLVKMGRNLVLTGVTAEQITTLCVVDDPDQVATLLGEVTQSRPDSMTHSFARAFHEEADLYDDFDADAESARYQVRGLLAKVRRFAERREVA